MAEENKQNPTTDQASSSENKKDNPSKGSGLFSKLKGLISKSAPTGIQSDDFRKEKKVLGDYKDLVKSEQARRKEPFPVEPEKKSSKEEEMPDKHKKLDFKVAKKGIIKKLSNTDRWKAPQIIKTNLIKGEVTTIVDWNKNIKVLIPSIILPIVVIALLYGALLVWEKQAEQRSEALGGEIEIISQQIRQTEKGVVVVDAFQKKLSLVSQLLDKHIYWTNFFKFLEDNLLTESYLLGGFSGVPDGNYSLGIFGKNYESIANQVRVLEANEQVKMVSVSGGSLAQIAADDEEQAVGVNFTLDISLDPEIFHKE